MLGKKICPDEIFPHDNLISSGNGKKDFFAGLFLPLPLLKEKVLNEKQSQHWISLVFA